MQCSAPAPHGDISRWVRGALLIRDRHKRKRILSLAIPGLHRTTTRRRGSSCCAAPGTRDWPPTG